MEWYDGVILRQEGRLICACEKFGLDKTTKVLRLKSVDPGQNLWALPIQGTIVVWIWITGGKLVMQGVKPGTPSNPPNPNDWHGTFEHVELYAEAAKQGKR